MDFIRAVELGFKKIFTYEGRANRKEFFLFFLFFLLCMVIAQPIIDYLPNFNNSVYILGLIIVIILLSIVSLAMIAVCVRRMHDLNLSGALVLPLVCMSILQEIFAFPSLKPQPSLSLYSSSVLWVDVVTILLGFMTLIICLAPTNAKQNGYGEPSRLLL